MFVWTAKSLNCIMCARSNKSRTADAHIWKCFGALLCVIIVPNNLYRVYATIDVSADLHPPTQLLQLQLLLVESLSLWELYVQVFTREIKKLIKN